MYLILSSITLIATYEYSEEVLYTHSTGQLPFSADLTNCLKLLSRLNINHGISHCSAPWLSADNKDVLCNHLNDAVM